MSIIDTANDLLKKGMALNDPDLIKMANELLEQADAPPPEPPKKESPALDSLVTKKEGDFISSITNEENMKATNATPVNQMKHKNLFVDEKTDALDITTPSYTPTARDRKKTKKLEQKCEECRKTTSVLEIHVRDYFVCDSCLARRRR